jgi:hypothetical protein
VCARTWLRHGIAHRVIHFVPNIQLQPCFVLLLAAAKAHVLGLVLDHLCSKLLLKGLHPLHRHLKGPIEAEGRLHWCVVRVCIGPDDVLQVFMT